MIYEVENLPKKISLDLLDRAVSFASEFLELDVDLVLQFDSLKRHQCGLCDYDEEEVVIIIAKRLSVQNIVTTLFHEMVHVKQYTEGRLNHGNVWLGKHHDTSYADAPWEIEAYELEEKMSEKFWR